tara:strand:- start:232 stop:414 length:183 start_codon:yes stop_codon:yes gene_type:complete
MKDFLEYEETQKTIKTLNLDDFSIEDLKKYILELNNEINRVNKEIKKKSNLLSDAEKYFK